MDKLELDEHICVIVNNKLNGRLEKKVDTTLCAERHKIVETIKTMLWGVIIMQFTILGGIIIALIKTPIR